MEKILLTGSNGFVGSYLIDALKYKYEITGLDAFEDKNNLNSFIRADITNIVSLFETLKEFEFDYVIHCAAISHDKVDLETLFKVNVQGTENLCTVFQERNLKRFIFFSSITVYGEYGNDGLITEKEALKPNSNYGFSKYEAEKKVKESNIPYFILRFPAIYTDTIFNDIQKRILLRPIGKTYLSILSGNGKQKHTFCYINNISQAINLLLDHSLVLKSECYQIADDIHISTLNIFEFTVNKQQHLGDGKILKIRIPKIVLSIGLTFLGVIFSSRRDSFKAIYWKLCQNNMYSTQKIQVLGFKAISLFASFEK